MVVEKPNNPKFVHFHFTYDGIFTHFNMRDGGRQIELRKQGNRSPTTYVGRETISVHCSGLQQMRALRLVYVQPVGRPGAGHQGGYAPRAKQGAMGGNRDR